MSRFRGDLGALRGSLAAVVTPFTAEGELDTAALTGLASWQLAAGSHGSSLRRRVLRLLVPLRRPLAELHESLRLFLHEPLAQRVTEKTVEAEPRPFPVERHDEGL